MLKWGLLVHEHRDDDRADAEEQKHQRVGDDADAELDDVFGRGAADAELDVREDGIHRGS